VRRRAFTTRRRLFRTIPAGEATKDALAVGARRTKEDGVDWSFGDVLWSMVVFFFWFMFIWMFIAVFGDIFRRDDLSGGGKAGWILLIVILPFLGILIYMIARPKMTEQDRRMIEESQEAQRRATGYSAADEVAKLAKLRDDGQISAEEYERLKAKAIG
jgi:hypothetical protein